MNPLRILAFLISSSALCGSAVAAVAYDSTNTDGAFFFGAEYSRRALDNTTLDAAFAGGGVLNSMTVHLFGTGAVPKDFDLLVRVYRGFNRLNDPVVSSVVGERRFRLNSFGSYMNGSEGLDLDLTQGGNGGIVFDTNNLAVELAFLQPGTDVVSDAGTPVFNGLNPAVGASLDRFYDDVNGDGIFQKNEAYYFGGADGRRANFALRLNASPVPGPASLLSFGVPVLTLLRRRQRA